MKNALLLALAAAVLFAVSAGLSLWLNQPKPGEEASGSSKSTARKSSTATGESREKNDAPGKPVVAPTPSGDTSEPIRLAAQLQTELAMIAKREQEFERQQEVYQVAIEDLRHEMDALQKHIQANAVDKKRPAVNPKSDVPVLPPISPDGKKPADDANDSLQNLRLATGITESMAPENAARIIEQMAKSGKIDVAVQLLAKLSPRQAAKILALISDEKLSSQIFEKLLATKSKPPANPSP